MICGLVTTPALRTVLWYPAYMGLVVMNKAFPPQCILRDFFYPCDWLPLPLCRDDKSSFVIDGSCSTFNVIGCRFGVER